MKKTSLEPITKPHPLELKAAPIHKQQTRPNQISNPPMHFQLTKEFFYSIVNKSELTNAPTLQKFKCFDQECKNKLQQFCLTQFENLPLFLLYQIGQEFGFQELSEACLLQLINENYEQLNYSKFDLVKCSFFTFQKILSQYSSLAKSLEIQGLKSSNLKSVIDDYCLMRDVGSKDKEKLYDQFLFTKEVLLGPNQREVRRSMIETSKTNLELSSSLKLKNTVENVKIPLLPKDEFTKQKSKRKIDQQDYLHSDKSAQAVKLKIEQERQKQALLFSEIIETRQKYSGRGDDNFLKESFEKLERAVQNMQKQIKAQNQKLKNIQKSACDIKAGSVKQNKVDFIFPF